MTMHTILKELLPDAEGRSEYIIALFIDIRGFSSFSKTIDSTLTAIFIKKFYLKLITDYFQNASFFKPTGDGLMITIPTNEKELKSNVIDICKECFDIVTNFSTFFKDEPMINFPVPDKVGIGLARGPASFLISDKKIIDYSGDVLNKAARLMDIARPSGIVFDSSFGINLLSEELQKEFSKDTIYIRSFAENEPIDIYYSKKFSIIPPLLKIPISEVEYAVKEESYTFQQLKNFSYMTYSLTSKPLEPDKILIKCTFPKLMNRKVITGLVSYDMIQKYDYFEEAGEPRLKINFVPIYNRLKMLGIKNTHKVKLNISYVKLKK